MMPVNETDPDLLAACRPMLSAEERARTDRFRFERDATLYAAAHVLLRKMLAAHGVPDPRFRVNAWGKPELDGADPALRFNLTHTRGLAACAVTPFGDLGIDAEAVDPAVDCLDLARHFFAPQEAAFLAGLPPDRRGVAFCRLWTLKEAFIKAVGQGLSIPLDAFSFTLDPVVFSCVPMLGQNPSAWRFATMALGARHRVAVALHQPQGGPMSLDHVAITPGALFDAPASRQSCSVSKA
jgi:4'-phosphopantetheinyl transferase